MCVPTSRPPWHALPQASGSGFSWTCIADLPVRATPPGYSAAVSLAWLGHKKWRSDSKGPQQQETDRGTDANGSEAHAQAMTPTGRSNGYAPEASVPQPSLLAGPHRQTTGRLLLGRPAPESMGTNMIPTVSKAVPRRHFPSGAGPFGLRTRLRGRPAAATSGSAAAVPPWSASRPEAPNGCPRLTHRRRTSSSVTLGGALTYCGLFSDAVADSR